MIFILFNLRLLSFMTNGKFITGTLFFINHFLFLLFLLHLLFYIFVIHYYFVLDRLLPLNNSIEVVFFFVLESIFP